MEQWNFIHHNIIGSYFVVISAKSEFQDYVNHWRKKYSLQ